MRSFLIGSLTLITAIASRAFAQGFVETAPEDLSAQAYLFIGAGLGLMIAELWLPSFGLIGVTGFLGIILGTLLLTHEGTSLTLLLGRTEILIPLIVTTLICLAGCYLGFRAQKRRILSGKEGLVGSFTEALEDFDEHKGQVRINGEIWTARTHTRHLIKRGDSLQIESIEGLELWVKPQ